MSAEILLGVVIGVGASALWHLVGRILSRKTPVDAIQVERAAGKSGPFLFKKEKQKRIPKSHTDEEAWLLENKDKML